MASRRSWCAARHPTTTTLGTGSPRSLTPCRSRVSRSSGRGPAAGSPHLASSSATRTSRPTSRRMPAPTPAGELAAVRAPVTQTLAGRSGLARDLAARPAGARIIPTHPRVGQGRGRQEHRGARESRSRRHRRHRLDRRWASRSRIPRQARRACCSATSPCCTTSADSSIGVGEPRPRIQVIVGDDGGGTIFAGLEVGATADPVAFDRVLPHRAAGVVRGARHRVRVGVPARREPG